METIHVRPLPGGRVRDPDDPALAPLPPEGKSVVRSPFWLRLIQQGEVELGAPAAPVDLAAGPTPPAPGPKGKKED
jgi:hypothetical protein